MAVVGFWFLFLLAQAASFFLATAGSSTQDMASIVSEDSMTETSSIEELHWDHERIMNLEDYGAVDPVPGSSAASIHSGPIEHGTPLMPYIPKPTTAPPSPSPTPGYPLPPSPAYN